jgi:hypothetical protein
MKYRLVLWMAFCEDPFVEPVEPVLVVTETTAPKILEMSRVVNF